MTRDSWRHTSRPAYVAEVVESDRSYLRDLFGGWSPMPGLLHGKGYVPPRTSHGRGRGSNGGASRSAPSGGSRCPDLNRPILRGRARDLRLHSARTVPIRRMRTQVTRADSARFVGASMFQGGRVCDPPGDPRLRVGIRPGRGRRTGGSGTRPHLRRWPGGPFPRFPAVRFGAETPRPPLSCVR